MSRMCRLVLPCVVVALLVYACTSPTSPSQFGPRLRVTNIGNTTATALVVQFPSNQITFGSVSAGTTTQYLHVPDGVYRYAAYQHRLDGQTIHQPVIDWVGEQPMDGRAFTYTIRVDASRPEQIELVGVTRDE